MLLQLCSLHSFHASMHDLLVQACCWRVIDQEPESDQQPTQLPLFLQPCAILCGLLAPHLQVEPKRPISTPEVSSGSAASSAIRVNDVRFPLVIWLTGETMLLSRMIRISPFAAPGVHAESLESATLLAREEILCFGLLRFNGSYSASPTVSTWGCFFTSIPIKPKPQTCQS